MGIRGENIRLELVQLAVDLPAFFDRVAADIAALQSPIDYYSNFRKYILKSSSADPSLLPALRLIATKGAKVTAFELKFGRAPTSVEAPSFGLGMETAQDDAIDFGDDAPIDFGADDAIVDFGDDAIDIAVVGDDTNDGQLDDGVARGDDALSIFENPASQRALMNDLNELKAFLRWRVMDEKTEHTSDLLLTGADNRDSSLSISESQREEMLNRVQAVLSAVNDPQKRHLLKIRASPRYVESMAEQLEVKRSFEGKYRRMKELMNERQQEMVKEAADTQQKLQLLLPSAKELQKQ
uniref:Uncharacterized protein n=1 Tax=Plectus sambesii TaxID=2011161 RepID=A0A914UMV3_9BILA